MTSFTFQLRRLTLVWFWITKNIFCSLFGLAYLHTVFYALLLHLHGCLYDIMGCQFIFRLEAVVKIKKNLIKI